MSWSCRLLAGNSAVPGKPLGEASRGLQVVLFVLWSFSGRRGGAGGPACFGWSWSSSCSISLLRLSMLHN